MDEARLRANVLGKVCEEGDDVVLGFAFDFVDARHIEGSGGALFPNDLCRLLWDHSDFGEPGRSMGFDLEPDAKAGLRRPDRRHFGAAIAGDHCGLADRKGAWEP